MSTPSPGRVSDQDESRQALRDLRAARRRHRTEQLDWVEALYRAYLVAIFGAVGVALLSGALNDAIADRHAVREIARHGPAILGLAAALGIAAGLRSGGRGGPLAMEAAYVQHVLLAPVDRQAALRGLALRRLRTTVFVSAVIGAIVGNLVFRRMPGEPAEWVTCCALFGAMLPLAGLGSAMIASGLRLSPVPAALLALGVVGWSVADIALDTITSPLSMLGELALWPVHQPQESLLFPALGLASAIALAYLGLRVVGGTSLEAARRRADLAAQLRFALTFRDLRAVILLRRQLASETPRSRPWVRLRPSDGSQGAVWKRDWQSFLRWPAVRVARVCVLGVVTGVSLCGVWAGTTPLILVAALALLLAAYDAIEPLAQEIDHPTRRDLVPQRASQLIRRHLIAPVSVMVGVCLVALATALVVGPPELVLEVGGVMVLPVALLMVCSAALSASNDPYAYVLMPAFSYGQTVFPFGLAVLAVAPVLAARAGVEQGHGAGEVAGSSQLTGILVCIGVVWWLGRRIDQRVAVRP